MSSEFLEHVQEDLEHSGVKGMKWGVRKDALRSRSSKALEAGAKKFNTSSVKALNNDPRFKGKNLMKNDKLRAEYDLAAKAAFKKDVITGLRTASIAVGGASALAVGFSSGFSVPVVASLAGTAVRGTNHLLTGPQRRLELETNRQAEDMKVAPRPDNAAIYEARKANEKAFKDAYDDAVAKKDYDTQDQGKYVVFSDYPQKYDANPIGGEAFSTELYHAEPIVYRVDFELDENGFITNAITTTLDLKQVDEDDADILVHVGVKGMRWGFRKSENNSAVGAGVSSEDAMAARLAKSKAAKGGVSALSNEEIRLLNTRSELETRYRQLSAQDRARAEGIIKSTFKKQGKSIIDRQGSALGQIAGDAARDVLVKKLLASNINPTLKKSIELAANPPQKKKK